MKLCIHLFCKVLMLYHRRSNMAADLLSLFLLSSTEHQNRFGGALSSLRMCPWDFRKHACWSLVDNFSFHYQRISAKWCAISCEKRGWRPLKQGFLCVLWKQKMGKYKSVRYLCKGLANFKGKLGYVCSYHRFVKHDLFTLSIR